MVGVGPTVGQVIGQAHLEVHPEWGICSTSGDRAPLEEESSLDAGAQLCPLMGWAWLGPQPAVSRHPSSPPVATVQLFLLTLHRMSLSDHIWGQVDDVTNHMSSAKAAHGKVH